MGIESISDILERVEVTADLKIGLEPVFVNGTVSVNIGVVPSGVPDHYHRISDEVYYIHKGQGTMRLGDTRRDVAEGDFISIPRGTVHGLVKRGGGELIIFVITSPPFDPEHDRFTI
ncbi:MAG: cupin domain-containing protein [Spirochaetes bacterium]|nr:cupin domain-containing protein [Spirochaetota bacterium]